jgi:hypothetical protein
MELMRYAVSVTNLGIMYNLETSRSSIVNTMEEAIVWFDDLVAQTLDKSSGRIYGESVTLFDEESGDVIKEHIGIYGESDSNE